MLSYGRRLGNTPSEGGQATRIRKCKKKVKTPLCGGLGMAGASNKFDLYPLPLGKFRQAFDKFRDIRLQPKPFAILIDFRVNRENFAGEIEGSFIHRDKTAVELGIAKGDGFHDGNTVGPTKIKRKQKEKK